MAGRFAKRPKAKASIKKEFKPEKIQKDLAERMLRWACDPQWEEYDVSNSGGCKRLTAACELLTAEACEAVSKVVFSLLSDILCASYT